MHSDLKTVWGTELHFTIKAELDRLDDEMDSGEITTPSGLPYDGCRDCELREILTLALPLITEAYRQGLLE